MTNKYSKLDPLIESHRMNPESMSQNQKKPDKELENFSFNDNFNFLTDWSREASDEKHEISFSIPKVSFSSLVIFVLFLPRKREK